MSIVEMKCPNCGGKMNLKNSQMYCSFCKTVLFEIDVPVINGDISIISAEDFAADLKSKKQTFVININEQFKVVDAKTEIINIRLENAEKALDEGNYASIKKLLEGVPNDLLPAARLRFLASCQVKSEKEFADGYDIRDASQLQHLINICSGANKKTYQKILDLHIARMNQRVQRQKAPAEDLATANELSSLGKRDSAREYMKRICAQYPHDIDAWMTYAGFTSGKTRKECYLNVWKILSQMTQDEQYNTCKSLRNRCWFEDKDTKWLKFSSDIVYNVPLITRLFTFEKKIEGFDMFAFLLLYPYIFMRVAITLLDIILLYPRIIRKKEITRLKKSNIIKVFPKTKEVIPVKALLSCFDEKYR